MHAFFPEGISTFILLLGLVGCASMSVESGDWERIIVPVTFLGLSAAIFGSVLAKLDVLDSLAHFLSMIVGIIGAFGFVLVRADELGSSVRLRVRPLIEILGNWYLGQGKVNGEESYLVSILMGIIVWLVGYLAAWSLFRRGWPMVSLLLPGFLVLINLLYAPHPDNRYLAVYLLIAVPLAARYQLYRRQREWSRARVPSPVSGGSRLILIGTVLGVLITTAGWQAPSSLSQSAFQPLANQMSSQIENLQSRISSLVDPGGTETGVNAGGSYAAFDDAFSVGGPVNLSDQPEMLVQSGEAPYLAAQRYDVYTGRGWQTDVNNTFDGNGNDGKAYAPSMIFRADQQILLSPEVRGERSSASAVITPLVDRDRTLFTIYTYLTSNIDASVKMAWQQLDNQPFPIEAAELDHLPPDLRRIATMLLNADLRGETTDVGPQPTDPTLASQLDAERGQLGKRFLTVRWTANTAGDVETLYVSGQLPVYDDVETVNAQASQQQGDSYRVTGLASEASPEQLMAAGVDYPEWVLDRYRDLGTTVTPRTIELAQQLAPATMSPYERAVAIESYLRNNISYTTDVSAPPSGADMVDYVLFERQEGYCEYYASAMAVMLRAVGVPARVVTGYYPGDYDASLDGFVYPQSNAHAWVEAYFPGYGWIPFEPTASRPLMDQGEGQAADDPQETQVPLPTEEPSSNIVAATATPPVVPIADETSPQVTPADDGSGVSRWFWIGGGAALILLGVGLFGWFSWSWRLRGLAPSAALFLRLTRLGRFAGIRASPATTPREYADSFTRVVPASSDQVDKIVRVYELDQYGPQGADQSLLVAARDAWSTMRSHMIRVVFRRRR